MTYLSVSSHRRLRHQGTEFLLKEGELLCLVPIATTPALQQKAALSNLTPARALSMAVSFKCARLTPVAEVGGRIAMNRH